MLMKEYICENIAGFKNVTTDPLIINNVIKDNDFGLFMRTNSWWQGHVDDRTTIKNNTINNNDVYGIYLQAEGSNDTSGSDTDVKPIIENNLLYENNTNIFMLLKPLGADGGSSTSNREH